ncbi:MAG: hypothetical protein F4X72_06340, partial [Dehalococcoidia bacterium]|nr:hypothetical protein [Dehalococcoidia bacterium]
MHYSTRYEKLRLDELGIPSHEDAEELEYELDLRFESFTPSDRRTWLLQSNYLEHFSRTGTVSFAAKSAGVSIYKAQSWQYDNILGFTRRNEVASLIFNDRMKQKALLRASDPKAPATLLIALLRAYIPEEFSRNGHKCDSSKSGELLLRYRENAHRDWKAGHPDISKLAENAENDYHPDDWPTEPADAYEGESVAPVDAYPDDNYHTDMNDYPDDNYHTDMNDYPAETVNPDDTPPLDESDGYQHDRPTPNRHTGANGNPQNPSEPAAVNSSPSPVLGESLPRTRYGG